MKKTINRQEQMEALELGLLVFRAKVTDLRICNPALYDIICDVIRL
jgi:hypothetical protein